MLISLFRLRRNEIIKWLNAVGLQQIVLERGLDADDNDFHTSLSGGQQQRVMWARMLYNVVSRGASASASSSSSSSSFVLLGEILDFFYLISLLFSVYFTIIDLLVTSVFSMSDFIENTIL